MNRALGLAVALLACWTWAALPRTAVAADDPIVATVVYLVRHAEKQDDGPDPALTAAGAARVQALRRTLGDARVGHVHSTDYLRTRMTAAALSQTPRLYDPRDLDALVAHVKSTPGRHLIVGHSNTTPDVVRRLGGDPGPAIVEKTEYDRLYVVTLGPDGAVSTVLLRYGAPSPKG